ncbi:MAG: hypothetical protein HKN00_09155 [Flavobacteriaceae bacterium]|nr:(4Fe-4S)-binding protein [Bacteroidia bacterium]MBT8288275.1 (4Fe-4S)-binding protein [Bacteroidia bacterium]NNF75338.1 hypothetical protein [Flavobacteriaceae bacterium]NNK73211.1 hypothetical protein [Flavobacteriaceae bacterium]
MSTTNEIIKEYSNGELTVIWKPKTCVHAGECVKRLPQVYRPDEKPWISVDNATTEQLKNQIDACPSGALTYRIEGEKTDDRETPDIKVAVMENGPLLVHGTITVSGIDGNEEQKKKTTAFCRCGASANKPYCDGAHKGVEFKG